MMTMMMMMFHENTTRLLAEIGVSQRRLHKRLYLRRSRPKLFRQPDGQSCYFHTSYTCLIIYFNAYTTGYRMDDAVVVYPGANIKK